MPSRLYLPQSLRRMAAYFIDEICLALLLFPLWRIVWDVFFVDDDLFLSLPAFFFLMFFPALYQFVFWSFFSRTPGQWVMGLWLVQASDDGRRVTWTQALLRALAMRLSLFFSYAIYLVAFFRYDRTHLGDWVAETRVMQEMETPRRIRLHPIVGTILILLYISDGFSRAMLTWECIDWENGQIEMHDFMDSYWTPDIGFEMTDESDD